MDSATGIISFTILNLQYVTNYIMAIQPQLHSLSHQFISLI